MLASTLFYLVALISSTAAVGALPAVRRRDELETASSIMKSVANNFPPSSCFPFFLLPRSRSSTLLFPSRSTSNPALAFLEAAIVVVPLNGNDDPQAQRSHLLLRPSLTPTSPLLDLVGAAGSLPTNSLPNELFPLSLESVAPTLFFSLALPPKPTPTSSSPPVASPNQQQQQDEEEEPTTTRDGVIASSLVGAIVAVGLVGVVWCLVRAKLQRKSKFRREKEEERKDGGSELGETGWEEKGGEAEVLEGLEKHREENERDGMEVRLGFVVSFTSSFLSLPLSFSSLKLKPSSSPLPFSVPLFSQHLQRSSSSLHHSVYGLVQLSLSLSLPLSLAPRPASSRSSSYRSTHLILPRSSCNRPFSNQPSSNRSISVRRRQRTKSNNNGVDRIHHRFVLHQSSDLACFWDREVRWEGREVAGVE